MTVKNRKPITPNLDTRLVVEVNNTCPLCGKRLLGDKAGKSVKLYEIAHIYPHSPNPIQLISLKDVPKPENVEAFENLIALCKNCHKIQDFHATDVDYMNLYTLKQKIIRQTMAMDSALKVPIETQIEGILRELVSTDAARMVKLSYRPVTVERKISPKNGLLLGKVKGLVVQYFSFIQSAFGQLDEIGVLKFNKISTEVKLCFISMNEQKLSQEDIFNGITKWIQNKTKNQYDISACEIIVAFFVQNCEVFDETA